VTTHRKLVVTALLIWYVVFSAVMAIAPASRQFWVAANILPVLFVIVLTMTRRLVPLSTGSYCLITIFLTLHTIGVHYTYSQVPLGGWMQQALHLNRNHFDRIVHFSFGFLLTYPLEEWFRVFTSVRGWLIYYLPVMTILGLSGLWEILESWVARIFKPELGLTFLGSQGDVWDAQKDMTAALYGSLLCVALIVAGRKVAERSRAESSGAPLALEESS
jgi:putative membrane protein